MSKLVIPNKAIFLGFCEDIEQICSPLKYLGITYFNYVKIYKDGSRIDLSSHLQATEYYYYKNKGYESHTLESDPLSLQTGISLWKSMGDDPTVRVLREEFNIDNGTSIIEKNEDYCEIYYFASTRENTKILDFYFNHLNVLKLFIYHFKDKAVKIIKQAENNKIQMADKLTKEHNKVLMEPSCDDFLNSLNIKRYHLAKPYDCYLTSREVECLNWCIKGKSAEEIAMILGCSATTATSHLENVKRKLRCSKQIQLAKAAYDLGLIMP